MVGYAWTLSLLSRSLQETKQRAAGLESLSGIEVLSHKDGCRNVCFFGCTKNTHVDIR